MDDASVNARTLLIVDDDATFRTRLVRAFESRGLSVRAAGSYEEAIELLHTA